jgi:hypothetical protein
MGLLVPSDVFIPRWVDTCQMVGAFYGPQEVNKRCSGLPQEFKRKLIAAIKESQNVRTG